MTAIFEKPIVYLITEGNCANKNFSVQKAEILEKIRRAVSNNISLVQLREKKLAAGLLFQLAAEAAGITKNTKTGLLVNDRADIALAAGADGVHLTENSIPAQIIRQNFPPNFIIGVSAHTLAKAEQAKRQKADFAVFSPIFDSPGKSKLQGLNVLSKVCNKLGHFPIIALGGIDDTNYESVLKAGAAGFAAIRFLNDEANLRKLKIKTSSKV